jgi:uncharacterized Zn-binding protein involved in type VI secretion
MVDIIGVLSVIGAIAGGISGIEKFKSVVIEGEPVINTDRFKCKCSQEKPKAIKKKNKKVSINGYTYRPRVV